jgi:energy-coupling factor transporter transmembrane protein EcfT
MKEEKRDIWFPAKQYGVGWEFPVTLQGWVVLMIYILLTTAGAFAVTKSTERIIWFLPYILILTILLIFICWKKGEKMQWRWCKKQ